MPRARGAGKLAVGATTLLFAVAAATGPAGAGVVDIGDPPTVYESEISQTLGTWRISEGATSYSDAEFCPGAELRLLIHVDLESPDDTNTDDPLVPEPPGDFRDESGSPQATRTVVEDADGNTVETFTGTVDPDNPVSDHVFTLVLDGDYAVGTYVMSSTSEGQAFDSTATPPYGAAPGTTSGSFTVRECAPPPPPKPGCGYGDTNHSHAGPPTEQDRYHPARCPQQAGGGR